MKKEELRQRLRQDYDFANTGMKPYTRSRYLFNLMTNPSIKYMFWVRHTRYYSENKNKLLFVICHLIQNHYTYKYGYDVSYKSDIGGGIGLCHVTGIIVYPESMGNRIMIRNGVTIGESMPGSRKPRIGNNIYIGTGAKILGDITIGNNVIIGANAVVTHDIPSNSVAVGIPARVVRKTKDMWGTPMEE